MSPTQTAAGKVEAETQNIVSDMQMMSLSSLALHHGIMVSEKTKTELRRVLNDFVHQSVEIQAAVAAFMDRPPAA